MFLKKRRLLNTKISREGEKRAALLEEKMKKRESKISKNIFADTVKAIKEVKTPTDTTTTTIKTTPISPSVPTVIAKDTEEVKIIDSITTTTVAPLSKKYKRKRNK